MTDLSASVCEPCKEGAPLISQEELDALKPKIPEWSVIEVDGVKQLQRVFVFQNFVHALTFANKVGDIAEEHEHHPAILVEWGKATVTWWTHKINGLHKNDVIMAAKTDELY